MGRDCASPSWRRQSDRAGGLGRPARRRGPAGSRGIAQPPSVNEDNAACTALELCAAGELTGAAERSSPSPSLGESTTAAGALAGAGGGAATGLAIADEESAEVIMGISRVGLPRRLPNGRSATRVDQDIRLSADPERTASCL